MEQFSVLHWIILAAIVYVAFKAVSALFGLGGKVSESGSVVCTACGTRGNPKTITKGSLFIEIVLWICFIVPGVIYTLWRLMTRHSGCPKCGSSSVVPADSPVGKKLITGME